MNLYGIFVLLMVIMKVNSQNLTIVTRSEWNARNPKSSTNISIPVPLVIIHHSEAPAACYTLDKCKKAMRSMQNYHMDVRGWDDIGYNFAVGSEGRIYEGRGWSKVGAQAKGYNRVSFGICFIGNWTDNTPPTSALESAKNLIELGVRQGYVTPEYVLTGHRVVTQTNCPGRSLFAEIQTWPHFSNHAYF